MSRSISNTFTEAMFAPNTAEVPLVFLELTSDDFATLRFVNNTADVTSNGDLYTAFPFMVDVPPEASATQLPLSPLRIDNVSREIIEEIRSIDTPPKANIFLALHSTPDTIEAGAWEFTLLNATYDSDTIQGSLGFEDILNELFPYGTFNPKDFPALF